MVLDCIEDALAQTMGPRRNAQGGCIAVVLYDQAKAFDAVATDALDLTLERARLPLLFRSLVRSGIVGARSRVRTFYGLSKPRIMRRGLRQGDPLSTLLYIFYIDPLHRRLAEVGGRWGYEMGRL